MNRLKIKNFKAYREELDELILDGKSFLVYGENGSGKSSIYEAIKVVFFRDRLAPNIPIGTAPENITQINHDFWDKYKNKNAPTPFEIEINNTNYTDFDSISYQVFMIAMDRLCVSGSLRLDELLENFDLEIEEINEFCHENYETIQTEVNSKLQEFQEKNISIVIDNEDDFSIKITDSNRDLSYKENITDYFNEAKLNLIILLLLFEAIKCAKKSDPKKILVLDDFITSLDMSNRTFLMKYILETFGDDFQIVILTHNVYFYNLIMYLINDIYKSGNKWKFGNIYEIDNQHKIYTKDTIERASDIKKFYERNSENREVVGNKIRQRFEVLLYEISKLLMVGGVEDSKKILERVELGKSVYFKNKVNQRDKNKTASDLVDEIKGILDNENLKVDIEEKINSYQKINLKDIQKTIIDLKLYQKMILHPMSHGIIGQSLFTTNDIEVSLELLKKLEDSIKSLTDSDVDGS